MALAWVHLFLLAGLIALLKATRSLNISEKCAMDTGAFLREINQGNPKEYAVLSKYCFEFKQIRLQLLYAHIFFF